MKLIPKHRNGRHFRLNGDLMRYSGGMREQEEGRPLILSLCEHGETQSKARIDLIRECTLDDFFQRCEFLARGIEPLPNSKTATSLDLADIEVASAIFVHKQHVDVFCRKFGQALFQALIQVGLLHVEDGKEVAYNHRSRDVRVIGHHYTNLIRCLLSHGKFSARQLIDRTVFDAAAAHIAEYEEARQQRGRHHH